MLIVVEVLREGLLRCCCDFEDESVVDVDFIVAVVGIIATFSNVGCRKRELREWIFDIDTTADDDEDDGDDDDDSGGRSFDIVVVDDRNMGWNAVTTITSIVGTTTNATTISHIQIIEMIIVKNGSFKFLVIMIV